jgi:hypothetical protein
MKLALFYNLKFVVVYISLENMLFICWTSRQICLFEFIQVEGVVKFMKHFKRGSGNKRLGTSLS